ncbi:ADP-ribose glycohydrolase MACROD2 isoform X2 [Denticeps clupeoides]|uniref:ADP-ribose glycohydrolase MACROD2 isoform X2 n=1 Tax=Denticeps clupeoides TaxID=299321 RepID=UPI0010A2CF43|nr:ADP-ribose glycohydrolase MACROD2 isoform X2 [Denticeps clupeoides]
MSKKKKDWKTEKERLLKLGLEERRKEYRSRYLTLDEIPTWRKHEKNVGKHEEVAPICLCDKVSLYKGDITTLEVDAIVNAANSSLLGGGGVDGCIHRAAGPCLYDECHSLNGCDTGKAKITCGYDLPAKYVIHTVGPIAKGHVGSTQREDLEGCYKNSLQLVKENSLRSVAFPCISTGIYGFPNEPAAEIALRTARSWLKKNRDEVERVIFCVFLETDYKIYKEKMSNYFSQDNDVREEDSETQPDEDEDEDKEACADADMLSQTDEKEEEDQEEIRGENEDIEMASQVQDEKSLDVSSPAEQKEEKLRGPPPEGPEAAAAAGGGGEGDEGEEEDFGGGGGGDESQTAGAEGSAEAEEAVEKRDGDSGEVQVASKTKQAKGGVDPEDGGPESKEGSRARNPEPMDMEDSVKTETTAPKGRDPSTAEAQGEDSQEPELTQTDSNQSKDEASELKKE